MTLNQLVATSRETLERQFSRTATWIAAAPGRVNLVGGHVDYNDGIVLPLAIDRYTVIAGSPSQTGRARFFSQQLDETFEIDLTQPILAGPVAWNNYIAGVVAGVVELGVALPGFDAVICSSIPPGAGLSSSAALEVATATFLESMTGVVLAMTSKAMLCHQAENGFTGMPCGIMDQFASVFGQPWNLVKLDCQSHAVEMIPWIDETIGVAVIDSHARHRLLDGKYAERRQQSASALHKTGHLSFRDLSLEELNAKQGQLTDTEFRRARHIVTEIERTRHAAQAIQTGQWKVAGRCLFESHESLRDDYDVSCRELDLLVTLARDSGPDSGLLGMRMTGGGFGGSTVSLIESTTFEPTMKQIQQSYRDQTGIQSTLFTTQPARGAHIIQ